MLTLIGLGPADTPGDGLSLGAWRVLQAASGPRFLLGQAHPAARWLQAEGGVSFDAVLDDLPPADATRQVLNAARVGDALCVLPGHPLMGSHLGLLLSEAARRETLPLKIYAPAPPPSASPADFDALRLVMARLRDPETGCPWDREQTPQTLRKYSD